MIRYKVWRVELMELDGEEVVNEEECETVVIASEVEAEITHAQSGLEALENIYMFAKREKYKERKRGIGESPLDEIIRFCERGGCQSSPLRTATGEKA